MKNTFAFAMLLAFLPLFLGCNFGQKNDGTPPETIRETTPLQDKAAVKKLFMEKYDTPVNEMSLENVQQDKTHMRGTITMEGEAGAETHKNFLAVREENAWKIVFENQGEKISCDELEKNEFPDEMSADCA